MFKTVVFLQIQEVNSEITSKESTRAGFDLATLYSYVKRSTNGTIMSRFQIVTEEVQWEQATFS